MPSAFAPRSTFFEPVWLVPFVFMVTSLLAGDRFCLALPGRIRVRLARVGVVCLSVAQCSLDAAFGDRAHLLRQALAKLVQAIDRQPFATCHCRNAFDCSPRRIDAFGRDAVRLAAERIAGVAE